MAAADVTDPDKLRKIPEQVTRNVRVIVCIVAPGIETL